VTDSNSIIQNWVDAKTTTKSIYDLVYELHSEYNIHCLLFGIHINQHNLGQLQAVLTAANQLIDFELKHDVLIKILNGVMNSIDSNQHKKIIDIGTIAVKMQYQQPETDHSDLSAFLQAQWNAPKQSEQQNSNDMSEVVIVGFGLIERLLLLQFIVNASKDTIKIGGIVLPKQDATANDLNQELTQLKQTANQFNLQCHINIKADKQLLICNDQIVQIIYAKNSLRYNYTKKKIYKGLLIDLANSATEDNLTQEQLAANGIYRVVTNNSTTQSIANCFNQQQLQQQVKITCGSYLTYGILPLIKALDDSFGTKTVHIDCIVPETQIANVTNANQVILQSELKHLIPTLSDSLSCKIVPLKSNAEVLAIVRLQLKQKVSVDSLVCNVKKYVINNQLYNQIYISTNSNRDCYTTYFANACAIIDKNAILIDDFKVTLYVKMNDNIGYSHQIYQLITTLSNT